MIQIKGQLPRHALTQLRKLQDLLAATPQDSLQAVHIRAAIEELVTRHGGRIVTERAPSPKRRRRSGPKSSSVWMHPAQGETRKPGSHRSSK